MLLSFGVAAYLRGVLLAEEEAELPEETVSSLQRYMQGIGWKNNVPALMSRTVAFTETDDPLPRLSAKEFEAVDAMMTISDNPDLF